MNALKCCFNWRVIASLAVIAIGVAILQPSWLAKLGPLLIYGVCPLSMLAMMWTMDRMQQNAGRASPASDSSGEPMVTIPASLFARLSKDHAGSRADGLPIELPGSLPPAQASHREHPSAISDPGIAD